MGLIVPAAQVRRPLSLIRHSKDGNSSETGCCGKNRSLLNDEQRTEKSTKHDPKNERRIRSYC